VVREDRGVRVAGFLLVSALFAGVGWAIDRGVAATRSADDLSYSARLARTQSKALGFVTVLALLLAVVVALSTVAGLPRALVWAAVTVSCFAVLPLVRWLGLRFPRLGLPMTFDDPDIDLGDARSKWTLLGSAFVVAVAFLVLAL
jgi:hypothetical protein